MEKWICSITHRFPVFRSTIVILPLIVCFFFPSTVKVKLQPEVTQATCPSLKIFRHGNSSETDVTWLKSRFICRVKSLRPKTTSSDPLPNPLISGDHKANNAFISFFWYAML
jgi:hypothetical protein